MLLLKKMKDKCSVQANQRKREDNYFRILKRNALSSSKIHWRLPNSSAITIKVLIVKSFPVRVLSLKACSDTCAKGGNTNRTITNPKKNTSMGTVESTKGFYFYFSQQVTRRHILFVLLKPTKRNPVMKYLTLSRNNSTQQHLKMPPHTPPRQTRTAVTKQTAAATASWSAAITCPANTTWFCHQDKNHINATYLGFSCSAVSVQRVLQNCSGSRLLSSRSRVDTLTHKHSGFSRQIQKQWQLVSAWLHLEVSFPSPSLNRSDNLCTHRVTTTTKEPHAPTVCPREIPATTRGAAQEVRKSGSVCTNV